MSEVPLYPLLGASLDLFLAHCVVPLVSLLFFFITPMPRVEGYKVYQPEIRALLGTAAQLCKAVVLKVRTALIGTALSLSRGCKHPVWRREIVKMAPKNGKRLQERAPDDPRRTLRGT